MVKKQAEADDQIALENTVQKTNDVALQAIKKELNLEAMIKQEEAQREQQEEANILKRIEDEQKKSVNFNFYKRIA